jgi:uncharacterized protein (TIGR00369 family)
MTHEQLKRWMEEGIPFNRLLGVTVTGLAKGFARLEVPFRDELVGDPMRPALHGGVLSALADATGGAAVFASVDDERARVSTIDLRIDYLRPARLERLAAEAHVVRLGNRVGVVDVRLFHPSDGPTDPGDEGETIATGKGVYNISVKGPRPA